jgi:hypothetical protein
VKADKPERVRSLADLWLDSPMWDDPAWVAATYKHNLREAEQMLLPLLDEHKISRDDPGRWIFLAFTLAAKLGAFRREGAPQKWDDYAHAMLILRVTICRYEIAIERGCAYEAVAVIDACKRLIEDNPTQWVTKKGGRVRARSLQQCYQKAPPSSRRLLQEILNEHGRRCDRTTKKWAALISPITLRRGRRIPVCVFHRTPERPHVFPRNLARPPRRPHG